MGFGKTFLACLLAIIVGSIVSFFLTILVIVGLVSSVAFLEEESVTLNQQSVLMIDLSEPIVEVGSSSLFDNIDLETMQLKSKVTVYEAVSLIDAAADDPCIQGIYLKISPLMATSISTIYEVRQALKRFNENSDGKFIVAYGDSYSQGALYLSSVADKIYLNPAGAIDWSGMSATTTFYKGALDKLGVEPEIIRHGKFKGAVEPFMLDKMSPENRLQMEQLLGSVWGEVVKEIALSRSLSVDTLQSLASNLSIVTPGDALRAGLVDSVVYRDQFIETLDRLSGQSNVKVITLGDYRRSGVSINGDLMSSNRVAVIYANGEIVDVPSSSNQIVGNDLAAKIREARTDNSIKSIVLRVNSPGGSALASEVIRREVELARREKPVVVSMGAYAASGGYWISCSADEIVTTPVTLTGSIGVFGLMFNVEKGAREKLGVTFDVVKTNPSADLGSVVRPMTRAERLIIQNSVDTVYNQFISNVSQGRDMPAATVDSLGEGRVWSGLQAVSNGLANKCGGLKDAVILAAEKAGLQSYRVTFMSKESKLGFSELFSSITGKAFTWIFGADKAMADGVQEVHDMLQEQGVKAAMEQKITLNY